MVDLVLDNVRVGDVVTSLNVVDGVISSVVPSDARHMDAEGRWVIPGLWDQHAHVAQWAIFSHRLDVSDARSACEAADRCAAAPGDFLVARGFQASLWPEAPTTALLDDVCGQRPVALIACDLHCAWANSAAQRALGWAEPNPAPLVEHEAFEFQRRLPSADETTVDRWVAEAGQTAAARGIVGIVDMEMSWGLDAWERRMSAGYASTRIRSAIYPEWLPRALDLSLRTGQLIGNSGLLEVGPLKAIIDGSLNTRTAWCHAPYVGSETVGVLNFDQADLHQMLQAAQCAGLVPALHAIGDRAVGLLLDLFGEVGVSGRIEHAQLVADVDVDRFAALDVVASVQPQHALDDRDVADRHWSDRTSRVYRFRDLLDAGAELAFGSDAPVAPLDPWHQIQAAVERGYPGTPPWHPEQSLTFAEALAASVDGRRLRPGEPADLCLLDVDPSTLSGVHLREAAVAATMLAGNFTHTTW